jgi:hypothetical protein
LSEDASALRVVAGLLEPDEDQLRSIAENIFGVISPQAGTLGLASCGFNDVIGLDAEGRQHGIVAGHAELLFQGAPGSYAVQVLENIGDFNRSVKYYLSFYLCF